MKRILVVGLVVLAAVVVVPVLLAQAPGVRSKAESLLGGGGGSAQSSSQISRAEFNEIGSGISTKELRALVGEPDSSHAATVEGIEVECWYYGVGGATATYQLCFANGFLTSKLRFG